MDASQKSLALFNDASRWVVVPNVPVFDTFEYDVPARLAADGTQTPARKVTFDVPALQAICAKANNRERQTGDVCPLTLGHTMPGLPETMQPPVVGFARNFRVDRFGPSGEKVGALADFWYKREHWGQGLKADEYPRRSVELWFQGQMFDPIALLKSRTPMRDLGLLLAQKGLTHTDLSDRALLYPSGADYKLCFSMESTMPDPTQTPDANAPDAQFRDMFMRCMKEMFPHLSQPGGGSGVGGGQMPGAGLPGAAPPQQAMPSPAPAMPQQTPPHGTPHPHPGAMHPGVSQQPGPVPHPNPMHQPQQHGMGYAGATNMIPGQHPPQHQNYQAEYQLSAQDTLRLQQEQMANMQVWKKQMEEWAGNVDKQRKQAMAEKLHMQFAMQGYDVDGPTFVQRFMNLPEPQWDAEKAFLLNHLRQRDDNPNLVADLHAQAPYGAPVGGYLLPLDKQAPAQPRSGPDGQMSREQQEQALAFIRQQSVRPSDPNQPVGNTMTDAIADYERAVQHVNGKPK